MVSSFFLIVVSLKHLLGHAVQLCLESNVFQKKRQTVVERMELEQKGTDNLVFFKPLHVDSDGVAVVCAH